MPPLTESSGGSSIPGGSSTPIGVVLYARVRPYLGQVNVVDPYNGRLFIAQRERDDGGAAQGDPGQHPSGSASRNRHTGLRNEVAGQLDDGIFMQSHGSTPEAGCF